MEWVGCAAPSPASVPRVGMSVVVVGLLFPLIASEGNASLLHECKLLCTTTLPRNNATETLDKVVACDKGCASYSRCHEVKGRRAATLHDISTLCLAECAASCTELFGSEADLRAACVRGCNGQHQQKYGLAAIGDAQFSSQRLEILDDAATGVGITGNETRNVSLNIEGNIQTDIKAQASSGPNIRKNNVATKGAKKVVDKNIAFNLQGEITNETSSEAALAMHGKGGYVSYGKRGREASQNTSVDIQGVVSQNGSYVDVSSQYIPPGAKGNLRAGRKMGGERKKRRKEDEEEEREITQKTKAYKD
ncbi:uncharacterized protein LOC123514401 [Portunus trituberculatus]|uniref:uncharacterized protein LOC123514401 n=1 Tax=Portunus trituberculatus TaxID=210409 RepID=UPI001E1D10A9|nr:uncharacterized protein LOC123514401 [Portunus trituberculatus]